MDLTKPPRFWAMAAACAAAPGVAVGSTGVISSVPATGVVSVASATAAGGRRHWSVWT
ncbi:MAG: hypothetical protein R2851_12190 [Caldilineaceae bacterium]